MAAILIGILEDDSDQSALLQVWLEDAGYRTRVFASGPQFIAAVSADQWLPLVLRIIRCLPTSKSLGIK